MCSEGLRNRIAIFQSICQITACCCGELELHLSQQKDKAEWNLSQARPQHWHAVAMQFQHQLKCTIASCFCQDGAIQRFSGETLMR